MNSKRRWVTLLVIAFILCLLPPFIVPLFQICCGIMYVVGCIFGLGYKEICVIGNVYIQGAIWALSAFLPFIAVALSLRQGVSLKQVALAILSFGYGSICSLIFLGFVWRYQPPLIPAFDLCVENLRAVARQFGTTYEVVNIIFFVVFWALSLIGNGVAFYLLRRWLSNEREQG